MTIPGFQFGFRGYLLPRLMPLGPTRALLLSGMLHGVINMCFSWFALFMVAVAPLALEYLAGETGVLTLLATVGAAGYLLYRLGRQRGAAQQLAPRAEVKI